MDTFSLLKAKRPAVIQIAAKHGAYDVRVFGSVVRGEDHPDSDIDLATQSHIRWEEIAGFRNVLVHAYLGIDLETIWGIMQHEVGELRTAIQAMLDVSVDDEG